MEAAATTLEPQDHRFDRELYLLRLGLRCHSCICFCGERSIGLPVCPTCSAEMQRALSGSGPAAASDH